MGRALLGLFLVLALCAGVEITAQRWGGPASTLIKRSSDPELAYELVPGAHVGMGLPTPERKVEYLLDEQGCRVAPGPAIARPEVVVLGGSMGFGIHVMAEETLPAALEGTLRIKGFSSVHVANCSVPFHRVAQVLRSGELVARSKQPKLFVVLLRPHQLAETFDYAKIIDPEDATLAWLLPRLATARVLHHVYRRPGDALAGPFVTGERLEERLRGFEAGTTAVRARSIVYLIDDGVRDVAVFDELKAGSRKHGVPFEQVAFADDAERARAFDGREDLTPEGVTLVTSRMVDSLAREISVAGVPSMSDAVPRRR